MAHAARTHDAATACILLDKVELLVPPGHQARLLQIKGARAVVAAFANDENTWDQMDGLEGLTLEMFARLAEKAWRAHGRADRASGARKKLLAPPLD